MTVRISKTWLVGLAVVVCFESSTARCLAQRASDKAAAEALFREAGELMEALQYSAACDKYQASHQLDPALGTLLRLADCYDRTGKSASAWALFAEAEALAMRSDQLDRAEIAATRAAELKARLSTLRLEVSEEDRVHELSITVNGAEIPSASWGTALPCDPGVQVVKASAPGYKPWSTRLELLKGPVERSLQVPELAPEPKEIAQPRYLPAAPPVTATAEPAAAAEHSNAQTTLGYAAATAGLLSLVTGGALAYRAYALNNESLKQCASDDANACTVKGKNTRDDARLYGSLATVASGVGGGLLLTGLVLVLSSPTDAQPRETAGVWLAPRFGPESGGVRIEGVF